jgi:alpha-glucosidase
MLLNDPSACSESDLSKEQYDAPWWRGAVIYQVYPRSMMDTNGDGVGDLPGVIEKLDYIKSLGVDAVWVSPFFKSPMKDFGYDISDYRDVDPLFGTLDDFDRLVEKAHSYGIKVMIDQVLSHTSDQHAWFQESRQSRNNDKADWYVWADPKEDGTPPNNWLSIFGGSAWQWEPRRCQYYLHNFLRSQPDLNFHNPNVRQAVLDEVEFWLKRGVDGFRLDAINFCFHDQQLRSNPPKPVAERKGRGFREDNPYAFQRHLYDNTQPENIEFIRCLRALMDRYPGVVTLGEVSSEDSLKTMVEYTAGNDRLHMAYSFELLVDKFCTNHIRETVETLENGVDGLWPCWSISNHDVVRVVSRWGGDKASPTLAKALNALLLSLRGSVCSYQGDELGLTEAEISPDELQDPYGVAFWPMFKGRDGCRTPIPWRCDVENAGFSSGQSPWLPIPDVHKECAVDIQERDPDSVLNAYRTFVGWRRDHPALRLGDIRFLSASENCLMFVRSLPTEKILVCINLSSEMCTFDLSNIKVRRILDGHGFKTVSLNSNELQLDPHAAFFAEIDSEEP